MKKKGFTLVELLVVIAIIALLMGILMPALSKVRQIAYRIICGSNLTGIGKAMMAYSQEYDEQYPLAGPNLRASWVPGNVVWTGNNHSAAFPGGTTTGGASITSCFYLLAKYGDVNPKQFICKGDDGAVVCNPTLNGVNKDLSELWDFGPQNPGNNVTYIAANACSYSYQLPFTFGPKRYGVSASSPTNLPVCSDRNPYYDKNATYRDGNNNGGSAPRWAPAASGVAAHYEDVDKTGNAAAHQRDGQNVVFQDAHIEFAKYPNCGINNDNIFKVWTADNAANGQQKETGPLSTGLYPTTNTGRDQQPKSKEDSFMCSEVNR